MLSNICDFISEKIRTYTEITEEHRDTLRISYRYSKTGFIAGSLYLITEFRMINNPTFSLQQGRL